MFRKTTELKAETAIQASNYFESLSRMICFLDKDTPDDKDGDLLLFCQGFQTFVKQHCLSGYMEDAKRVYDAFKHSEAHIQCATYEGSLESNERMKDYLRTTLIAAIMADSCADTVLHLGVMKGEKKLK